MIIRLEPICKETVWGGSKLREIFNIDTPYEKTGEVWCISGLKDHSNVVMNSTYKGQTLYQLWQNERHLFGHKQGDFFPILVKLIDAQQDLSIQVHPNDEKAKARGL